MDAAVSPGRHPVLRRGERKAIPLDKRWLIYERDGYACGLCGYQEEPENPPAIPGAPAIHGWGPSDLELDHLIPWSANGSDRSDNLRTLCGYCNAARSNQVETNPPRLIGVVRRCYWCAFNARELPDTVIDISVGDLARIAAYCGRCGTTSWVPAESWLL